MPTIFVVLYAMLGHFFGDGLIAIGLTGGISTGKSTVSAVFKKFNAVIIDADLIARQVVEPGKPAYNKIVSMFGKDVINSDKTINRPMLGSIIFNNPAKRQALNACTHVRRPSVVLHERFELSATSFWKCLPNCSTND